MSKIEETKKKMRKVEKSTEKRNNVGKKHKEWEKGLIGLV